MHNKIISAFITAALCFRASVFSAFAAGTSEKTGNKGVTMLVLAVIFAVTLILTTFFTYRMRTKKLSQQFKDNEEMKKASSDNKEL